MAASGRRRTRQVDGAKVAIPSWPFIPAAPSPTSTSRRTSAQMLENRVAVIGGTTQYCCSRRRSAPRSSSATSAGTPASGLPTQETERSSRSSPPRRPSPTPVGGAARRHRLRRRQSSSNSAGILRDKMLVSMTEQVRRPPCRGTFGVARHHRRGERSSRRRPATSSTSSRSGLHPSGRPTAGGGVRAMTSTARELATGAQGEHRPVAGRPCRGPNGERPGHFDRKHLPLAGRRVLRRQRPGEGSTPASRTAPAKSRLERLYMINGRDEPPKPTP